MSYVDYLGGGRTRDIAAMKIDTGVNIGGAYGGSSTVTYSWAPFASDTPIAALVTMSMFDPANDPTPAVHASGSLGFTDGTTSVVAGFITEDNSGSTDTNTNSYADGVVANRGTISPDKRGTQVTLEPGSIKIYWSGGTTINRRGAAIGFCNPTFQADVGTLDMGTGTAALTVNCGFEPDVVFTTGDSNLFVGTSVGSQMNFWFGIAVNDGSNTQRCMVYTETNGVTSGGRPFMRMDTNNASVTLTHNTGAILRNAAISNFTSTGFDWTPSQSHGGQVNGYLALKTGKQKKLMSFDTPTSTGDWTISGVGFKPNAAIFVTSNLEAVNTNPSGTSDLYAGIGICFVADQSWSYGFRQDAGADPTDASNITRQLAFMGPDHTTPDKIAGTLKEFTSDGVTITLSATQGTAKKGFVLFLE